MTDSNTNRLIIHGGYHKCGTVWFGRVLTAVSEEFGLKFQNCKQDVLEPDTQIFMEWNSRIDFSKITRPYVGSHVVRDPRDVIISGYFYHLWCSEEWTHVPRDRWGGKSYQDYLNSLSQEEGIIAEMEWNRGETLHRMGLWNYETPGILEVKYEDMIRDPEAEFARIFRHYGFDDTQVKKALEIADNFQFKKVTGREIGQAQEKHHFRSGKPGDWENHFTETHKVLFKYWFKDLLIVLGYEKNNDW